MMWVPAQQTSAVRGTSITLKCFVESHPEALTFWEYDGRMIQANNRIKIYARQGSPAYKVHNVLYFLFTSTFLLLFPYLTLKKPSP